MNTFKTSPNGRKFIETWEGLDLRAYDDGTGVITIGYGHTDAAGPPKVIPGMAITESEADAILAADLASVEVSVNHYITATIDQNQFDALVSFQFNTGGLGRSSLMRDINSGATDQTERAFGMWVMGGGHVMQGLVKRRKAEFILFSTGTIVGP